MSLDVPADALEVCVCCSHLDPSRDGTPQPDKEIGWSGEGDDLEDDLPRRMLDDVERLFSPLRVARQGAVGESKSLVLLGDVHDAAGHDGLDRTPGNCRHYDLAGPKERRVGCESRSQRAMGLPCSQSLLAQFESPVIVTESY